MNFSVWEWEYEKLKQYTKKLPINKNKGHIFAFLGDNFPRL
jgi:hypothetical protein